jgi:hypothetical protein
MRDALRVFAERRSVKAKGVRQISQLRYAHYFERCVFACFAWVTRRHSLQCIESTSTTGEAATATQIDRAARHAAIRSILLQRQRHVSCS